MQDYIAIFFFKKKKNKNGMSKLVRIDYYSIPRTLEDKKKKKLPRQCWRESVRPDMHIIMIYPESKGPNLLVFGLRPRFITSIMLQGTEFLGEIIVHLPEAIFTLCNPMVMHSILRCDPGKPSMINNIQRRSRNLERNHLKMGFNSVSDPHCYFYIPPWRGVSISRLGIPSPEWKISKNAGASSKP